VYRSIATVKADLAQAEFGVTGRGIVWAVVSTGVDAGHRHFQAFRNLELPEGLEHLDYTGVESRELYHGSFDPLGDDYKREPIDPHGDGTGVAGLIAGESVDDRDHLLRGIVPQATILSVRVLDERATGSEAGIVAGCVRSSD
jgi:serine protease AprX